MYDRPITIQVQDETTEKWEDILHLHATVNKTGGGQSFAAGAGQYRARLTFEVRYCTQLNQLKLGVQPFRIVYISEVTLAVAKVENLDSFSLQQLVGKAEVSHVRTASRTINRKEALPQGRRRRRRV